MHPQAFKCISILKQIRNHGPYRVKMYEMYIDYLIMYYVTRQFQYKTLKYENLKMPTLPVPFANDKHCGSKLNMYGTRNKVRGINQ